MVATTGALVALVALVVAGCAVLDGNGTTVNTSPPVTTMRNVTYYADCDAVRDADAAPLHRGDPGYRPPLDRDGDGVACDDPGDDGEED